MPQTPTEPIVRQKLSDQVFDRLWQMVASGELPPGAQVPSERALMQRFGVGRPAVREALQTMANKGLITISHGERSRVNVLGADIAIGQVDEIAKLMLKSEPANLDHLKQMRRILEAGTVRAAALNCSAQDARALRDLVAAQRARIGDAHAFIQADIAFHVQIARTTGNPLLQAVMQAMLSWLFEYYRPLLHWSGHEETTLAEHAEIARLIGARDPDGAIAMMRNHLNRADPLYAPAPD